MTSPPRGLDEVLDLLVCPHCRQPLGRPDAGTVACVHGHRFDIARQGYVALLGAGARTDTADSADMVAARAQILTSGAFDPLLREVARAAGHPAPGDRGGRGEPRVVVELGAGTGHYLAAAVDGLPGARGLAVDSSRYASRRAASVHPRVGAVLADAWSALPVRDGCAEVVLNVFAPRNPTEIHRMLAPGGRLVCLTPRPGHLGELRAAVPLLTVDEGKHASLVAAFDGLLLPVDTREIDRTVELTGEQIGAVIRMGPTARHVDAAAVTEAARTSRVVTLSVTCTVLARD